ncbi:MAG: hypothetical protein RLZZ422_298 [Pseudomonadota bacterium]|jgi:hypothetical protein
MVMKVYLKLMLALVCVLGSSGRAAPLEATGVGFGPQPLEDGIAGYASFYKNFSTDTRVKREDLKPLPSSIKQGLLSALESKSNLFKPVYKAVYTAANLKKLQGSCPFVGLAFEIDNNKKTQEWFTGTLSECTGASGELGGNNTHIWLIQKNEQGIWQVLMEGDSTMDAGLARSSSSYKQLWTQHYVSSFAPQSGLGCGRVPLRWNYHNGRYRIIDQGLDYHDCARTIGFDYPPSGPNDAPIYISETENTRRKREAEVKVNAVVQPWLQSLKAFR